MRLNSVIELIGQRKPVVPPLDLVVAPLLVLFLDFLLPRNMSRFMVCLQIIFPNDPVNPQGLTSINVQSFAKIK